MTDTYRAPLDGAPLTVLWAEGVRTKKLVELYGRLHQVEDRAGGQCGPDTLVAVVDEADTWSTIIWELEHETRPHSLIMLEQTSANRLFLEHRSGSHSLA